MTAPDGKRGAARQRLQKETLPRGVRTADEALLQSIYERPAFLSTDAWRMFRIQSEFVEGFDTLAGLCPAVTIFGSARTRPDDPMYAAAEKVAAELVRRGFSIIT